jgi:catechol 2,3-dioxygenase-like lactoylglutathione lyase family enzyme
MKRVILVGVGFALIAGAVVVLKQSSQADETKPAEAFSSQTIDLGVVVADAGKSAKFYTEAIGFKEVNPFDVPGDFAKESGLNDGAALKIRVLTLGDEKTATKLKLVQSAGAKGWKNNNEFIDSEFGFRYITIFVNDTTAALERLSKAGVKPIAKGPVELPKGLPQGVFLTCVKDPDGNMVELVGPKK